MEEILDVILHELEVDLGTHWGASRDYFEKEIPSFAEKRRAPSWARIFSSVLEALAALQLGLAPALTASSPPCAQNDCGNNAQGHDVGHNHGN